MNAGSLGICALGVVCASLAASAGCGGSSNAGQAGSPQEAADASAATDGAATSDAGAPDADLGSDADQDPNVYPAMHAPIAQADNLGGPILDHPKLVTVTFTGYGDTMTPTGFASFIGTSAWWHATVGAYGIADATNGGAFVIDNAFDGQTVQDADFQAFLVQKINAGALPAPDGQTLYVVWLPTGTILVAPGNSSTCSSNGGYHNGFVMSVAAAAADGGAEAGTAIVNVPYAIAPDCGQGADTLAASHEIAEAVTDPMPLQTPAIYLATNDAWLPYVNGQSAGGEIGDLCELGRSSATTAGSYPVQRIWSNAAAAASKPPCQPNDAAYYGVAVETKAINVKGTATQGHIVVARGASVTANAVFFSSAPLPNDAQLAVGVPSYGYLDTMPTGVTATLSRTTAHNGQALTLTVAASSSATKGQTRFVVRSSLNAQQYVDWPIMLNVN